MSARSSLAHPESHKIFPLDLSKAEFVKESMSKFLLDNHINVSFVVFAAGVFALKPVKLIDYDYVRRNFDIALFSIWSIMRPLINKKINNCQLHSVVLVSSISAKMGTKGYSVYGAVKSGMLGMMKSMAVELAPGCRVNAILPGGIRTRSTSFMFDSQDGPDPRYLMGEGQKTDVAEMVEFLLSDKSNWITGQEFIVDGGWTCH